jgi:glucose/arabinose dehydrogenase
MRARGFRFASAFSTALVSIAVHASVAAAQSAGVGADPKLPAPDPQHSATKFSKVIGWPDNGAPKAPAGFKVTRFAAGLDSPRWLHVLPNGDVLVAESTTEVGPADALKLPKTIGMLQSGSTAVKSANRITLLRDTNADGAADERHVLLSELRQPFGIAFANDTLFVANTDGVLRFPYKVGDTKKIEARGQLILPLPASGYNNHWTRNLLLSRDGNSLYVSVGSASNVGEQGMDDEVMRAAIHQVGLDGSNHRIVATGLRNPVGMSIEPSSGKLWTAVNERDMLGDDLVPDYITSVTEGGFYGWPYSYWGKNPDPRLAGQGEFFIQRALTPDFAVGSHTATLGVHFTQGTALPEAYRNGAFVTQRGSWNRSALVGYKVMYVPFRDGKPAGETSDFLTGFVADQEKGEVYGRPVGTFEDQRGGLLVTDDAGNSIWRISAQ